LKDLKRLGVRVIGAHAHTDRKSIAAAEFTGDTCIVFGSEGYGLSPQVLTECDDLVLIPMAGGVDSLNVGSSVAVFLYEAARQRGLM
jgi:23S rRNA (guanosine2251-2'-O)-methyltransferase